MDQRESAQEKVRQQQVHPKLLELVDKSTFLHDRNLPNLSGIIIHSGLIPFYLGMRSYDECLEQIIICMAGQLDTTTETLTDFMQRNVEPVPVVVSKPEVRYNIPEPKVEEL